MSYHRVMKCPALAFSCTALVITLFVSGASAQITSHAPDLAKILKFEAQQQGDWPGGWGGGPAGTVFLDEKVVHDSRRSVRVERKSDSPGEFSTITLSFPMDFAGSTIQLRAFLRTEEVAGFAGLWMREDGASSAVAFDNMQSRQLNGTQDWKEYSITLPIRAEGRQLFFGFLLTGTGKAWASDLRLLVDGKPIMEAPMAARVKTILDSAHEFDKGSGLSLNRLSNVQIGNLATLGKVWGFLKYHHPAVTSGRRHWDYDLLHVLPEMLEAPDKSAGNAVLLNWTAGLGAVDPCNPCAQLPDIELHLRPQLNWISDEGLLSPDLSRRLRSILNRRPVIKEQFYVSKTRGAGNPSFDHELNYGDIRLPDAGFQLLGLYRLWNIIAWWFPYRDVLGEDWDGVLMEFIPRIALAASAEAYQRELLAFIARIHDTHANLWSSLKARPPAGECQLAVNLRFIEDLPVVASYAGEAGKATGLKAGDVITHLDGESVSSLLNGWLPFYAASNRPTQLRDIARSMTSGVCGRSIVGIRRENEAMEIAADRVPASSLKLKEFTHDLPGDTFRLLAPEVAYLKLSSVKMEEVPRYIEAAAGARGLIIDIRNYPSAFVVFALGSHFVEKKTEFVRFTICDPSNPGSFQWGIPLSLIPERPHFAGKIIILVDEVTQSSAEYTAMAFRASPGAKVLGSTTAGADGNVSQIPLPGGQSTMISGLGVFYPDRKPTQRIGIIPDIEVKPTIAGIRAGRDEVLEAAVREILGPGATAAQIEKMIKH